MTQPADTSPITIAIVNDYEVIVKGLRTMLADFPERVEVREVNWRDTPDTTVDIALFDTFASPRSSLERIEEITDDPRVGHVVLYTWDLNDGFTARALEQPVDAVISKTESGEALIDKLEQVRRGERIEFESASPEGPLDQLTEREREVLALLASGEANRQIGIELYISSETVKTHVRNILKKLDARNRTEAATMARELGLVRLARPTSTSA